MLPLIPFIVSAATIALTIASSVASTVARKSGLILSLGSMVSCAVPSVLLASGLAVERVDATVRLGAGEGQVAAGARALLAQTARTNRAGKYTFTVRAGGVGDEKFYREQFLKHFTCRLVLYGCSDQVQRIFEVAGLTDAGIVFDSRGDAIAELAVVE